MSLSPPPLILRPDCAFLDVRDRGQTTVPLSFRAELIRGQAVRERRGMLVTKPPSPLLLRHHPILPAATLASCRGHTTVRTVQRAVCVCIRDESREPGLESSVED